MQTLASVPLASKRNNVCGPISLLKEFPLSQSVGYYFFTWPVPEIGSSTTEFGYQVTSVAVKPTKYTFTKVPAHWRKGKLRILWLLVQCKQHRRGLSNVSFEKRTLNPSDSVHWRFCFHPIICTSNPKNHPQIWTNDEQLKLPEIRERSQAFLSADSHLIPRVE